MKAIEAALRPPFMSMITWWCLDTRKRGTASELQGAIFSIATPMMTHSLSYGQRCRTQLSTTPDPPTADKDATVRNWHNMSPTL